LRHGRRNPQNRSAPSRINFGEQGLVRVFVDVPRLPVRPESDVESSVAAVISAAAFGPHHPNGRRVKATSMRQPCRKSSP
jgi:hypothetical protein